MYKFVYWYITKPSVFESYISVLGMATKMAGQKGVLQESEGVVVRWVAELVDRSRA